MIDRLYNIGVVPPWEQHRCIVPALIGAAAALGGSIYSNMRSRSNALEMLERQNKRQDYLSANAALLHRQAMSKAGLNINADIGYPTVVAPQGTPAQASAPDFTSSLQALMQRAQLKNENKMQDKQLSQQQPLIDAQTGEALERARVAKTQADAQQLQNDILQGKVSSAGSAGAVGALQWQQDLLKYDTDKLDYNIKHNKFDVEKLHNQLDSEVFKRQLKNQKVLSALENMPYRQSRVMVAEANKYFQDIAESKQKVLNMQQDIRESQSRIALNDSTRSLQGSQQWLADSQASFNDFKRKVLENTSVREYIDKTFGKNKGAAEQFLNAFFTTVVMHYTSDFK